jgi:phage terminase small subunit
MINDLTFALRYWETSNIGQSYLDAGGNCKSLAVASACGSRLLKTDKIQAELSRLSAQASNPTIMSVIERKQRLSEIARGKTVDFIDKHGNINTEAENNAAIAEITVEDWQGGKRGRATSRTKRIKLYNPVPAIDLLNKMENEYEVGAVINDIKVLIVREGDKHLHLPEGDE